MAAVIALGAGCLGDDRCGEGKTLEGNRCIPLASETGPDKGSPDSKATDLSAPDESGSCAFAPEAAELVGTFDQLGTVSESTCTAPLPIDGAAFDAEVIFSLDGQEIKASVVTAFATLEGTATIGSDGKVSISAKGAVLEISLSATLSYCFSDADNATAEVAVSLESVEPLCDFAAPGTLKRK